MKSALALVLLLNASWSVSYSVLPILQTPAVADAETIAAHRAAKRCFGLLFFFIATVLPFDGQ